VYKNIVGKISNLIIDFISDDLSVVRTDMSSWCTRSLSSTFAANGSKKG